MLDTDLIASLANPTWTLFVATLIVGLMTFVFYRYLRKARFASNRLPSRRWSVIAEICGVLGLMGLLTFAGRAKLDANEFSKSVQAASSHSEMYSKLLNVLKNHCRPFDYKSSPPTLSNGYLVDLCVFAEDYERKRDSKIPWRDLKYAVKKLAATNSTDAKTTKELLAFDESLSKYLEDTSEAHKEPIRKIRIINSGPWAFLLHCNDWCLRETSSSDS